MSQIVMGVHTGHDRGAAIVKDHVLIGAISQERIDRNKHSRSYMLPYEAMDALMKYCNLTWDEISCIGIAGDALETDHILNFLRTDFSEHYQRSDVPFMSISHHLAHAYSVYYASKQKNSLVLIADGGGDFVGEQTEAESLYLASDGSITLLEQRLQDPPARKLLDWGNHFYPFIPEALRKHQISIGRKYEQITYLLNFKFGEAGKTMGLASYGKSLIDYKNLALHDLSFSLSYEDILKELYVKEQLSGLPHHKFLAESRADIAATVQNYTETAVTSLIANLSKKYGIKNICLAGGLFLNCLTNHKILESCETDQFFILPAAGDDGLAIGSALAAYKQYFGQSEPLHITLPYLGIEYSDEEIKQALQCKNLPYEYLEDHALSVEAARLIANGSILGLHRGKTEIGPRALCHRSILADATSPDMKDILNHRVKHREPFRPFAPVVTYEDQFKIFDLKADSPFMLLATTVKEEYRSLIPSVTHVDGTARIQAVKKESEPFIHQLLKEFEAIKGVPVILNTSFNVAGEPIVETPLDAIQTFLKTNIDILIIGNYLVRKES